MTLKNSFNKRCLVYLIKIILNDGWLVLLGYNKIYNTPNPFPFMEMISLNEKGNFFETTVSQYSRANVGTTEQDREISFDCDDF